MRTGFGRLALRQARTYASTPTAFSLEPCVAVGVGKVSKGFGMGVRKADGTRLAIDDPALNSAREVCARLTIAPGIPQGGWPK